MSHLLPAHTQPERRARVLRKASACQKACPARDTEAFIWRTLFGPLALYDGDGGCIAHLFEALEVGNWTQADDLLYFLFEIQDWPVTFRPRLIELAQDYIALRQPLRTINLRTPDGWTLHHIIRSQARELKRQAERELYDAFFARRDTRPVSVIYGGVVTIIERQLELWKDVA